MKIPLLLLTLHFWRSTAFNLHRNVRTQPHCHRGVTSPLHVATQDTYESIAANASDDKPDIRPFHQNWWPVSVLDALNPTRPNGLEVLGKKIVAFRNNDESWNVMDDRCSHRFAPLSEGRVIEDSNGDSCLQCAYHGWEFSADGSCTRVPQQPGRVDKARAVQSYPTRVKAGILWVWTDRDSVELGETIELPVSPLLERLYDAYGEGAMFQRDLPYGMEILGENLLDLSHLPFAHHSVGMLDRELGVEMPMRMLSKAERVERAQWEQEYKDEKDIVLPTFQAEVDNASEHDPLLMIMSKMIKGGTDPSTWTTTIGYYAPNHVRYRRDRGTGGHVELFLCPVAEGKARVFLVDAIESLLPPKDPPVLSFRQKVTAKLNPANLKVALISKMFNPTRTSAHIMKHAIFDGDGIFLHKQGNRMREAGLTFADYSTPSPADVLLNAYRRFLDAAATKTRQSGLESVADAVVGASNYGNDLPRSEMLDRYNTHTVNCPICMSGLRSVRRKKRIADVAQTALQGSAGASTTALATLATLGRLSVLSIPGGVLPVVASIAASTWLASLATSRGRKRLEKEANKFLFEDYVHAEKD